MGTMDLVDLAILGVLLGTSPARAERPHPAMGGTVQQWAGSFSAPGRPIGGISGAQTYHAHCASCHGAEGRGDGPRSENLLVDVPDLRRIRKRNGGRFPAEKIERIVDGREPVKGHGGGGMPVWGDAFKNADTGYDERVVKEKIRAVVQYLRTLQVD